MIHLPKWIKYQEFNKSQRDEVDRMRLPKEVVAPEEEPENGTYLHYLWKQKNK